MSRIPRASASTPEIAQPSRRAFQQRAGLILAVAGLIVAAYWPVLEAQSVALDDSIMVTANTLVTRPGWDSARRFFAEVLDPSTVRAYYMPLSMTSLMLDWAMGGRADDLRVFHRTNLVLHVVSAVLILLILEQLLGALLPAALAALLFGLHPLTVEAVASIGERKTLLAMCFAMLSVLCYVRYCRGRGRGGLVLAAVSFALALLSKPSVTTLPLMLLVLDYWPLRRLRWRTVWEKWPFVLLSIASAAITTLAVKRTWEFGAVPQAEPTRLALEVLFVVAFYLGKIVWPVHLTTVYPPPLFSLANPVILVSAAVCLGITALVIVFRRTPAPLVCWVLFVLGLAPTFGILAWSLLIVYDRYAYFPMFAIVLLAGAGLAALWRSPRLAGRAGRTALIAGAMILVAAEARAVRITLQPWKDSITYWRHVVALAPARGEGWVGLGTVLENSGAVDEAIEAYRRSIALDPGQPFAYLDLGTLLSRRGQADEAIAHLRRACALEPASAENFVALGTALQRARRFDEAAACLRHSLELRPGYIPAIEQIGMLRLDQGRGSEAIELLRSAVALSPLDIQSRLGLAVALRTVPGHAAEARDLLRQLVRDAPEMQAVWNELAWLLATHFDPSLRDATEALRLADQAVSLTHGRDPNALDTRAAALAAAGRFEEAARTARAAEDLAARAGLDSLDREIGERRRLYEAGKAYVQPQPSAQR